MSLNAEIIAVGTELTNGAKLDTNSQWLSRELEELGHPVRFHTTVADTLDDQVATLRMAFERSDLIIMTGGLGPTLDDLARDAIAVAVGDELKLDPKSLAAIEGFFRSRGREMPERNRMQAMFPSRSEPLANPIGTAPGVWYVHPKSDNRVCFLASLPGVPVEMQRMFHEQVMPRLPKSSLCIRKQVWHCFGLGESDVEQRLGELTARGRNPEVGITAHEATISLRIVARGTNETECQTQIAGASAAIHNALGDRVFGSEQVELEDVVLQQLAKRAKTLVTLELGSSAFLATRIQRAVARASEHDEQVRGSFCFATRETARKHVAHLKCSNDLLIPDTGDSAGFQALANAFRQLTDADICIAVDYPDVECSGVPQPGLICLVGDDFDFTQSPAILGSSDILHSRLAKVAIDLVRRKLKSDS